MRGKEDKQIFGICRVSDKGQIVIPKAARQMFDIRPGDSLLMLGDRKRGIALIKTKEFSAVAEELLGREGEDHEHNP